MKYRLSVLAEEDIIDIFMRGVEEFGVEQAKRYHQQLADTFVFLQENPLAARERVEIVPPVRVHPVGSHLVLYQDIGNAEIYILRVRHAHEDWLHLD